MVEEIGTGMAKLGVPRRVRYLKSMRTPKMPAPIGAS
jgi:hypothetical protein